MTARDERGAPLGEGGGRDRTPTDETELEMVRRHVRRGSQIVREQRERIENLRAKGHPTARAEQALQQFEHTQRMHEHHLRRIEGD